MTRAAEEESYKTNTIVLSNALGSAAAGIIGRIATHPLDTAKARLQSLSGASYRGPVDVLVQTFRSEGIRGLYRGFPTVIAGGTPGTILYLCGYDIFKDRISLAVSGDNTSKTKGQQQQQDNNNNNSNNNEESFLVHFAAGILAEAVACVIYVPVDVIKERLQIQQRKDAVQYKGGFDALVKICKTEGVMGIYKGYGATLASFGPFSALYFVFYEKFKLWSHAYLQENQAEKKANADGATVGELPLSFTILSSASAGAMASFLTSPLDMAKLRLQVQRKAESSSLSLSSSSLSECTTASVKTNKTNPQTYYYYRGMSDALVHSYRSGGIPGLFRGAGARVIHFVPLTTIIMTSYEMCRNVIQQTLIQQQQQQQ